ncbi:MAG: hypothetical protein M1541_11075 [Acidobacteria bacterium]|nr:hypothetical protein [Acidobacteriota bacterium]
MNTNAWTVLGVALAAGVWVSAASPPEAEITNGVIRVRLYLPDAKTGFYRGTRFDWSGVIGDLEYAGHSYYPQWFQRSDPSVHDFIYDGDDIVAGPCTAELTQIKCYRGWVVAWGSAETLTHIGGY